MRDIEIKITKAHIRDGVPGDKCNCPIALAIKDTLLTENVVVGAHDMYINGRAYVVDKKDLAFMGRFDTGKRVRPYSFTLARRKRK